MGNETLKAVLMIAMFGALELALCHRRLRGRRLWTGLREAAILHGWPNGSAHAGGSHAMVPVRARRRRC